MQALRCSLDPAACSFPFCRQLFAKSCVGACLAGPVSTTAPQLGANCRFCAKPMPEHARYCTECGQFQGAWDRFLKTLSVSSLVALVPTVTLAVAFLNQNIERPQSHVNAVISRCTPSDVTLVMSNTGNRAGVIDGGEALLDDSGATRFTRGLRPPGAVFTPVVLDPGKNAVVRFDLADPGDLDTPLAMPLRPPPARCAYHVSLAVLEFGGRREKADLGGCTC